MTKTVVAYGLALAALAALLQFIEYKYLAKAYTTEIYVVLVAVGFLCLGVWVGLKVTSRRRVSDSFAVNERALQELGISKREHQVLSLLAEGQTNQELADSLCISPNTIKTHLNRLYEKLEVNRRTQAIQKARELSLIK